MKKSVAFTINLNDLGGAQQMFVPYYHYARQRSKFAVSVFGLYDIHEKFASVETYRNMNASVLDKIRYVYHGLARSSIIHFHGMLGGRRINRFLKMLPVSNVIFTDHGSSWYCTRDNEQYYRQNAERADLIIANGNAVKVMLRERIGVPPEKIKVIHNGFLNNTEPASTGERKQKVVGYIGRFVSFKGVHILIESAKRLTADSNIIFKIAGSGAAETQLREKAAGCKNIEFVGMVQDPLRFIADIDVLVIPSTRDPMPNVIVEAAFCRKPVIGAQVDGISEFIQDGHSGVLLKPKRDISFRQDPYPDYVVDPETDSIVVPKEVDPDELATAIRTLVYDDDTMRLYGERLYLRVKDEFTLENYFNQLEEVYGAMVE